MPKDFSINVGGQQYSVNNLPENLKLEDVQDQKLQKSLSLFDIDNNGVLSKDEISEVPLFFKEGYAQVAQESEDGMHVRDIWAKRPGKLPDKMYEHNINYKDGVVSLEKTKFNNNVDVQKQSQETYTVPLEQFENWEDAEETEE